ncbi:hypothetical protein [Symbiopectobacterium purcellii]|uniref:Uncharacterized protein n=1 Tax=Symbiopectobacterium purcellii TaxID=2871826 RepID=A0ABX9AXX2_9ENTR|nr:hypothetical protein [Symbiopectobacterium purcellii]QZN97790.1 hypothetical protein K6K13_11085 [Symbiopectobacterium purcellii]
MAIYKGRVTAIPGDTGPANSLSVGTVITLPAGSSAAAAITGTPPSQILNLGIPQGGKGDDAAPTTISVGTISTLPAGSSATASISGTALNYTLNLGIPAGAPGTGTAGPANALTIGTVSTLPAGSSAAATITGTSPNQTLNISIPVGNTGVGLSPGAPASISTTFGTATRPTDTTKPYKISVMIDAVYSVTIAGTVADTCELWIGPNATVGGTGWVKAESWRGSLTGILTLVGAGVGMRSPMSALVPAGWYFSARRISGTTATITEAYVTLLT